MSVITTVMQQLSVLMPVHWGMARLSRCGRLT